ncbi:hypothetical protein [Metabacillus endolithicus]|uniref:Uncharacterized protein n=1 Tax=Metabacillus endolithicus TaxID=1535204 RepID=A0ABW5BSC2_9BACI|nr:hypothetical protein [Metabacillus endolithicus]UPG63656.1 hypothetical protein MVE64_00260 [Metabacillus endolithicus]
MDEKILNLLTEMNKDLKNIKLDMTQFKTDVNKNIKSLKIEMHDRFDKIDAKLDGVGNQFELTNEQRINEFEFIADKVNKLEKEIYFLKTKNNN